MSKDNPEAFETFEFDLPPIRGVPELRWAGKRPFSVTSYYPAQKKEAYGDPLQGWWNQIFWGDNLQVMSHLLRKYRGKIKFAYIDPPFDSKADYRKRIELRGEVAENDQSAFEEMQYSDIWGADGYLQFMYDRLVLIRELLSDDGSIMLHCDWNKSHHLRCIMDEIFVRSNFLNEIYWYYYNKMPDTRKGVFPRSSDTILWYAKKKGQHLFKPQYEKRDEPVKRLARKKVNGKAVNARDEDGNLIYMESDQRTVDNVWRLSMLQPADKSEPTGYPTQKPETLLARAISSATEPGDIVFDCFMGSGTTQSVAMKLGRKFIGADINLGAIETTVKRLNRTISELSEKSNDLFFDEDAPLQYFTGFEVHNVNNYEVFRNPVEAKGLIQEAMELQPLPPNSAFDGQRDGYLVKIMPVNRIATRQDLNEVINGLDFKAFERRKAEAPNKPVERIHLVCMGHEPDLGSHLTLEAKKSGFDIEVMVTDLIRDKAHLHFKKSSDARLAIENGELVVAGFFPMNLLQKLSLESDAVEDWRQLVESVKVDFHYDGAVLTPAIVDAPGKDELVAGRYAIPADAATIRVKITDLLSESWEGEIENG